MFPLFQRRSWAHAPTHVHTKQGKKAGSNYTTLHLFNSSTSQQLRLSIRKVAGVIIAIIFSQLSLLYVSLFRATDAASSGGLSQPELKQPGKSVTLDFHLNHAALLTAVYNCTTINQMYRHSIPYIILNHKCSQTIMYQRYNDFCTELRSSLQCISNWLSLVKNGVIDQN